MRTAATSLIAATAILLSASLAKAQAPQQSMERTISVQGVGKAAAPPDMATIQIGVTSQGETAVAAMAANNEAIAKVIETIKDFQIASRDIQTSNFNINPMYEQLPPRPNQSRNPRIIGYQVNNQVQVRVRNLPELGRLLDSVITSGSNQIHGIQFGIDDTAKLLDEARDKAVEDARRRASRYAGAANVTVGNVLAISEQPIQRPMPQYGAARMMMAEASAVPIETGEQELQITINIVFAIED